MRSLAISNITSRARVAVTAAIFVLILTIGIRPLVAGSGTPFEVLSGDMIRVGKTTYCLKGIDAPEPGQICKRGNGRDYDCRHIAKTALMDLTAGVNVKCSDVMKQNACMAGSCEADGSDLSRNMIHTGWALSTEPRFAIIQTQAKVKKPGLWKGIFDTPWAWRVLQRQR
jgi:endonuclease YncB( thermonuclease family)